MAVYDDEYGYEDIRSNSASASDTDDEETLRLTYDRGCACFTQCIRQFSFTLYRDSVFMCRELTNEQLDLIIIGELLSCTNSDLKQTDYMFYGKPICRMAFCILHGISEKRLKNIKTHFRTYGIAPRLHKSKKRWRHNRTSEEIIYQFSEFLKNYAGVHGVSIPGETQEGTNNRCLVLPAFLAKSLVYKEYVKTSIAADREYMSERVFLNYWNKLHPYITHAKPENNTNFPCASKAPRMLKKGLTTDSDPSQDRAIRFSHLQRPRYCEPREMRNLRFSNHLTEASSSNAVGNEFEMLSRNHSQNKPGKCVSYVLPPKSGMTAETSRPVNGPVNYNKETNNGNSYTYVIHDQIAPSSEGNSARDVSNVMDDDGVTIIVKEEEVYPQEENKIPVVIPDFFLKEMSPQRKKKKIAKTYTGIVREITDEMSDEIRRDLEEVDLSHRDEEIFTEIKAATGPRHKLSLKLLRLFFSKEELVTEKIPKDNEKLKLVKKISFMRLREEPGELKDISWKDIIGRIYSRQRNLRNAKQP